MRTRKRWLALGTAVVLACVFAAGLAASQLGSGPPPPDVEALASAARVAPMTHLTDIEAGNGLAARGVFAQITAAGQFCLWDAPSASSLAKGGGCNPVDDPLGGHPLSASFAYDGGPDPADAKDARLMGLVSSDVADVEVVMSDGSRQKLALRQVPSSVGDFRVFAHRFGRGALKRGITPTSVVALDAKGTEIDRQATGF
jgi:hypothetical protein